MKAREIDADLGLAALLPGANFVDAFAIDLPTRNLDARTAAERALGHTPRWVSLLMRLRDGIVRPFGITTSNAISAPDRIGIFPVLSQTPTQLVAGFDDGHLDFRVVIGVTPRRSGMRATATTLVLTHNRLGRTYLGLILPFHRLVVRSMLDQLRRG